MQKQFKDPSLKLRYARGVGDIIACFLHSKPLGWLTKLITGKDKPCQMCSIRQQALNTLFPIPVWKLFFNSAGEATQSYTQEYIDAGHQAQSIKMDGIFQTISTQSSPVADNKPFPQSTEKYNPTIVNSKLDGYNLVSINESEHDHVLIRMHVYKRK